MAVYIVSGFMRSGTSMMMAALEAGGLEAVKNPERDKMNDRYGDEYYKPNAGGLYELNREQYAEFGFPKMHDGKLVKVLYGGIRQMPAWDYKVVFMRRDQEEIRQSYQAFFGDEARLPFNNLNERMDEVLESARMRRDMDVIELWYREVVDDPLKAFKHLHAFGWPIDPENSSRTVDRDQCRYRLEDLTVGI